MVSSRRLLLVSVFPGEACNASILFNRPSGETLVTILPLSWSKKNFEILGSLLPAVLEIPGILLSVHKHDGMSLLLYMLRAPATAVVTPATAESSHASALPLHATDYQGCYGQKCC